MTKAKTAIIQHYLDAVYWCEFFFRRVDVKGFDADMRQAELYEDRVHIFKQLISDAFSKKECAEIRRQAEEMGAKAFVAADEWKSLEESLAKRKTA